MNNRETTLSRNKNVTSISKVGQRRQVVIPKAVCAEVGLEEGDFVEVKSTKGTVVIRPKKLVDSETSEPKLTESGASLRRRLKEGALRNTTRDRVLAAEYLPLEEEAWQKNK